MIGCIMDTLAKQGQFKIIYKKKQVHDIRPPQWANAVQINDEKSNIETRATAENVYDNALSLDTQTTYVNSNDEDFNHYVNLDYEGLKDQG